MNILYYCCDFRVIRQGCWMGQSTSVAGAVPAPMCWRDELPCRSGGMSSVRWLRTAGKRAWCDGLANRTPGVMGEPSASAAPLYVAQVDSAGVEQLGQDFQHEALQYSKVIVMEMSSPDAICAC